MYKKINDELFILEFEDYRYEFNAQLTNKKDMMRATPLRRMRYANKVYNKSTELFEKERSLGFVDANNILNFARSKM